MPRPEKPSTASLQQLLAAELPAVQKALLDQAKSGNVAAIKLVYDLHDRRDLALELLSELLRGSLQPDS